MKHKRQPGDLRDKDYIPEYLFTSIPCLDLEKVVKAYHTYKYESHYYYDRETDTVIRIVGYDNIPEEVEYDCEDRFIRLPGDEEVPLFLIMRRFIETVTDQKKKRKMNDAWYISGTLKVFRNAARNNKLLGKWYSFYDEQMRLFLIAWCRANGCDWY